MSCSSEMEVDASLRTSGELSTDPPVGQETDYDGADEEAQDDGSDADSEDSARASKQALAAEVSGALDDDDDELFDMSFSNMKRDRSSSPDPEQGKKKVDPQT